MPVASLFGMVCHLAASVCMHTMSMRNLQSTGRIHHDVYSDIANISEGRRARRNISTAKQEGVTRMVGDLRQRSMKHVAQNALNIV